MSMAKCCECGSSCDDDIDKDMNTIVCDRCRLLDESRAREYVETLLERIAELEHENAELRESLYQAEYGTY